MRIDRRREVIGHVKVEPDAAAVEGADRVCELAERRTAQGNRAPTAAGAV